MPDAFDWPAFLPAFREAAKVHGFDEHVLATTPDGALAAWTRPGDGPSVYLSAGIHGDEPAGPLALLELMRAGAFTPGIRWAICPALNPAGLATGTRDNAEGTDLNRDYLKRSTEEARTHAAWLEQHPRPDLFLSLHEDWETTGFYLYEINQNEDRPDRATGILQMVTPWFPPEPARIVDDHKVREPGWIFHAAEPDMPDGWPEAIFIAKLGCPLSFTFETPSQGHLAARVAAHCAAVKAALQALD